MTALDRYLVLHHAPFVHKWRKVIIFTSITLSAALGILAWLHFSLYDGTIIVFKEKYNLGRVQRVIVSCKSQSESLSRISYNVFLITLVPLPMSS